MTGVSRRQVEGQAMRNTDIQNNGTAGARRSWLIEALVITGILAFGAFALSAETSLSPANAISGLFSSFS